MTVLTVLRDELKYYVNYLDYLLIRDVLKSALRKDENSSKKSYQVKSLYFDTIDNRSFYEKMYGLNERKKYRLRVYDLKSNTVKLEVKNKIKDKTYKETVLISKKDALRLIKGDYDVLLKYDDELMKNIYGDFKLKLLRPVVLVSYLREAFTYEFNRVRITFDTELSQDRDASNLFKDTAKTKKFLSAGPIIMEVKFNNYLPEWIGELLADVPSTRSAISKFCLSSEGNWEGEYGCI